MNINKETLKQFRNDFKEAVKQLEEKYSVDISLGNISYKFTEFKGSINVKQNGADKIEWDWACERFGFKCEDFGKEFFYNRRRYTIIGLRKDLKNPIIVKRDDGAEFRFSPNLIDLT